MPHSTFIALLSDPNAIEARENFLDAFFSPSVGQWSQNGVKKMKFQTSFLTRSDAGVVVAFNESLGLGSQRQNVRRSIIQLFPFHLMILLECEMLLVMTLLLLL